jgi:hypothetical protein
MFLDTPGMQRGYNFDVIFPDLSSSGSGIAGFVKTAVGMVAGVAVGRYCQSIQLGQHSIQDIIEMKKAGRNSFTAGPLNISTMNISFVVPAPDILASYFKTWRNKIIDDQGFYGVSNDYKKKVTIVLSSRSGIPTNMISVEGVFPKTFPGWDLNYAEEKIVHYNMEFSIDRVTGGSIEESLMSVGESIGGFLGG